MNSMPTIIESKLITGEELLEMKNVDLCELVEGRIVPMSPTGGEHGFIESQIAFNLKKFVSAKKLGWVLTGEVGIYTRRNPDSVRGADVVFISNQRLPDGPHKGFLDVAPELIVEIFSPTEKWHEIHAKIQEYFNIGVTWVWIVEPNKRIINIYHSPNDFDQLTALDTLIGEDILQGLEIQVVTIFEE